MSTAIALPRHKLSVTDYHQMITTGILTGEDHVELIDGDLIERAPAGPEHADFVAHLGRILRTQTVLLVREEKPVTLPEHSEPEPDIALVKPRRYLEAHPYPEDVLMIIEVADTSLDKDKSVKVPLYARFRIPEVWIVDMQGGTVESLWEPWVTAEFAQYAHSKRVERAVITSETIPGIILSLNELWKGNT
jgi:Uma2 family endonuclease